MPVTVHLTCPTCGARLTRIGNSFVCPSRHTFDISRSGYVNLLTSDSKHSKIPGDNKLMVGARRDFLEKGYYKPLCELFCKQALCSSFEEGSVLDAGCGEGYYTTHLLDAVRNAGRKIDLIGVDISKIALDKAAKRQKEVTWAVGSVFSLPVETASCSLACNLFAPYCGEELQRVLRPGGELLLVIPGENHLWQLKQAVYPVPYKNQVKDFALDGFELADTISYKGEIHLDNSLDIDHLFKMTPYYYKTSQEDALRLAQLDHLTTQIDFNILSYRKK